jgi:PAS domain S-box-containing protein
MDTNSRLILANRPALAMFGLETLSEEAPRWESIVQEMSIKNVNGEVLPFDDLPMSLALRGKKVVEQTLCWADPKTGSDRYIRVTAAPVEAFDGKGTGAVSIARDITEQRDNEQIKDKFIRVTAHELKTPLSVMKGYSEMILRQGAELPEQVQKMLVAIDRGADRIVRIVNDLLEISKFGKLEMPLAMPEKIQLVPFIVEVVERNALDSTMHRIKMGNVEDVWIQGDRGRLEQVLNNLLQNARKYSPEGGEITVSVIKKEGRATVCVKDQGIGIPLNKQQYIFQQFYRAHSDTPYNYGGMGVGLYISREFIRRHGGEMFFESEPGKGSSFCFSLPALGDQSAGAES